MGGEPGVDACLQASLGAHCGCNVSLSSLATVISDQTQAVVAKDTKSAAYVDEGDSEGRIGPKSVKMMRHTPSLFVDKMKTDKDGLVMRSHGNFASMRASTCVYKGRWMYEVILHTDGILQLGWATFACPFTNEEGVGDAPDSFSYDGKRQRRWNLSHNKYGERWSKGDVIGACIDLELGQITFYRNGKSMGVAFDNVRTKGPMLAYFPTLSLSYGERCEMNFGQLPLLYPVEGFAPLHEVAPSVLPIARMHTALIGGLLPALVKAWPKDPLSGDVNMTANSGLAELTLALATSFDGYGPLLARERSAVVPLAELLLASSELEAFVFFEAAKGCLEQHEFAKLVESLVHFLGMRACTASLLAGDGPGPYIVLSSVLFRSSAVLPTLKQMPQKMYGLLDRLFSFRQPNENDLAAFSPTVYWKEAIDARPMLDKYARPEDKAALDDSPAQLEAAFRERKAVIQRRVGRTMEELDQLVSLFLDSPSDEVRNVFVDWVKDIQAANEGKNKNVPPPTLSSPALLSNLFFALCTYLMDELNQQSPLTFPLCYFTDPGAHDLDPASPDLVGGTFSHVCKAHPLKGAAFDSQAYRENVDKRQQLVFWLIDGALRLYHNGAGEAMSKMADRRTITSSGCSEVTRFYGIFKQKGELSAHDQRTLRNLLSTIHTSVRATCWDESNLFQARHKEGLSDLFAYVGRVVNRVQDLGDIYRYVPEYYLVGVCKMFHALRKDSTYPPASARQMAGVDVAVEFSVRHFDDERIINPDAREMLLQSLAYLMMKARFVRFFEDNAMARARLMPKLLAYFNSRSWIHVGSVLKSVSQGCSFGTHEQPASASPVFQESFAATCSVGDSVATNFLNQLFNFLNTAVSEFRVALTELEERGVGSIRNKCCIIFELLSMTLMILEVIAWKAPAVLLKSNLNRARLCELTLLVLSSVVSSGSYGARYEKFLKIAAKDAKTPLEVEFTVLGPIAGIVTKLLEARTQDPELPSLLQDLVAVAGTFEPALVERLRDFDWKSARSSVTEEDLDGVAAFVREVTAVHAEGMASPMEEDGEEDLCPICCAMPMDTEFVPCLHRSCGRCIERHLLDNERCFFCNADVKEIRGINA
mmetsp:Transcript_873/g.3210  ORF Transcript_873/g.3210 Transcript_873/m.3210 type:complete len:1103 (-) Transcript_873:22-3330(-)